MIRSAGSALLSNDKNQSPLGFVWNFIGEAGIAAKIIRIGGKFLSCRVDILTEIFYYRQTGHCNFRDYL